MTIIDELDVTMTMTAYYSPIHNQREFVTGSYEKEIKLQGKGEAARDGTKPYLGMLAADWSKYPRRTKIFVPGYTDLICKDTSSCVHDTGGAIKGNRLDIWMGQGDIGREKVLRWERKKVKCKVISVTTEIWTIDN